MKKILLSYALLVIILLGIIPHTAAGLVQDSVYKYFQTIDFIQSGFSDFSIHNHNFEIDPSNKYGIFRPPFAHLIDQKIFMTFPWLWILLNGWIVKFFGFFGIYILPLLSGFFSIFALRKLLMTFTFSESIINATLWFYILCSSLVIYSIWYYEATLCNFLFYSVLLTNHMIDKIRSKPMVLLSFVLNVCMLILLVSLRTEVYYLSILSIFLLNSVPGRNVIKDFLFLVFYITIPVLFFITTNYIIWSHPEGLRFLVTHSFTIVDRILRIFEYLFFEKYSFLFYLPTFFLTIRLFQDWKKLLHDRIFRMYIACLLFIISIPLASPQQQGSDLMPRFYFPIIPILVAIILYTIDSYFSKYQKFLTRALFIQSSLFLVITMIVYSIFSNRMNSIYQKLKPFIKETSLVSNEGYGHLIQNSEKRNVFLANRESSLGFLMNILRNKGIKEYHLFIWEPELKNYSPITLSKDFDFVTKVYDISVYRKRLK